MDKEMLDLLKDGTMKGKNMWVRIYDEESGKQGWVRIVDIIENIIPNPNKKKISHKKRLKEFKSKREWECIICRKKYDANRKIIKEGVLKGMQVVDVYCSIKCRNEFENRLKLRISKQRSKK